MALLIQLPLLRAFDGDAAGVRVVRPGGRVALLAVGNPRWSDAESVVPGVERAVRVHVEEVRETDSNRAPASLVHQVVVLRFALVRPEEVDELPELFKRYRLGCQFHCTPPFEIAESTI